MYRRHDSLGRVSPVFHGDYSSKASIPHSRELVYHVEKRRFLPRLLLTELDFVFPVMIEAFVVFPLNL